MDLIYEVVFGLGDNSLNFMDLLVDNLVDLLHVVKHLIGLVIQSVKLLFIVFELNLATEHLLPRVVLFDLHFDSFQDFLLI